MIVLLVILGLCLIGVRIGFATLVVAGCAVALIRGPGAALTLVGQQVESIATSYPLSVVPLFLLMGVFVHRANLSQDLYDAAQLAFSRLRGVLAYATILSSAGFSAACGSSIATAATMVRVALPAMRRHGYGDRLSTGTIAAGGTLGIMIPPSVPLILYGSIAEQDIGLLFLAGLLPGLVLVAAFLLTVLACLVRTPQSDSPQMALPPENARRAARAALPVLALFALVLGGIYGRIFTPTEAAGIGAFGAGIIAVARGRLTRLRDWRDCFAETASVTASLFMIIFGASVFAQYLNLSGVPVAVVDLVMRMELGPTALVCAVAAIAIAMGMVFEAVGILLLLVPVFLPALIAAEVDLIWFGIVVVLVVELGLITPPVGMNVFVVKANAPNTALSTIFLGVLPFAAALLGVLAIVIAIPSIATFLPGLMGRN
ncbi:TRAP transporter large permease [Fluviibacterium sp. DFM31]|uniref:TRAP transporter large permease protein n=1 Tax=Meridianimarinicoccus marinus TaxID=3231483 RepID=A0ABV3L531_9RHOB